MRTLLALLIFLTSISTLEARNPEDWVPERWFILPGLGYSYFDSQALYGFEVSAVRSGIGWYGAYLDHYQNFGHVEKTSFGFEGGFAMFGLDAGYLRYQTEDQALTGVRVRPFISLLYVSIYAGGFFSNSDEEHGLQGFFDGGILLKLPTCFKKRKRGLGYGLCLVQ